MLAARTARLFSAAAILLAAALRGEPQAALTPVDTVVDALSKVRAFRGVAISPDGARVAWSERLAGGGRERDLRNSAIFLAEIGSGRARRVSAGSGEHSDHGMVFSPDGQSLAFLSDAEKPRQQQVYVAPAAGGRARKLTSVKGQLDHLRWSPDGRRIAFLFIEGSELEAGALVAYKPDAGVVEAEILEQRIAVVDAASGTVRQVSPGNLYVYDYDWSPDGTAFAAEAAEGSGTNNYWIAQLYTVRADTGETKSLWKPPLQIACPRFSPDGKSIAVIHGIMSDEGSTGGDIYAVPADGGGGEARNLTPNLPASVSSLRYLPSGQILATEHADGDGAIVTLDPASGKVTAVWKGPEVLASLAVARDGTLSAAVRHDITHPAEVWAGPIGAWKQMTTVNTGIKPFWGAGRSVHWESDGQRVQGWLIPPAAVEPGKRYPMIVSVHGGPASAATPGYPSRWNAVLPSQGYFLFLPNPRGSYGQGEAFTQGNVKDFGHGDLRDIVKGVDAVLESFPVDGGRVGVIGWSYGGYMTMWAVTQTNRFKAAVAGAGIVNWQSYYGQNRIDRWMLPYFGASVYDDPGVYEKSSPIAFIKKAKTPTLVLHGDRDSEVPTPQGYEFWHALKTLGVPTQLVIYENEGHAILQPSHQKDIERRVVAWFEKYLR